MTDVYWEGEIEENERRHRSKQDMQVRHMCSLQVTIWLLSWLRLSNMTSFRLSAAARDLMLITTNGDLEILRCLLEPKYHVKPTWRNEWHEIARAEAVQSN